MYAMYRAGLQYRHMYGVVFRHDKGYDKNATKSTKQLLVRNKLDQLYSQLDTSLSIDPATFHFAFSPIVAPSSDSPHARIAGALVQILEMGNAIAFKSVAGIRARSAIEMAGHATDDLGLGGNLGPEMDPRAGFNWVTQDSAQQSKKGKIGGLVSGPINLGRYLSNLKATGKFLAHQQKVCRRFIFFELCSDDCVIQAATAKNAIVLARRTRELLSGIYTVRLNPFFRRSKMISDGLP